MKETEIARILEMSPKMIPVYARVLGLPMRKDSSPHKKLTDEDLALIKEMWLDGATLKEIADYFEVHPRTVGMYLHAMGLRRRTFRKCPEIDKETLEKLCIDGLTDKEIAKIYNTTKTCIIRLRQKYGINKREIIRRRNKEKLERTIETIISVLEEKGYTNNRELREHGIILSSKLLYMLEEFIEDIKWFKLTYVSTRKYKIFPSNMYGMIIIYLKGYEDSVLKFLYSKLVNPNVPSRAIRYVLKISNAPKELLDKIISLKIIKISTPQDTV